MRREDRRGERSLLVDCAITVHALRFGVGETPNGLRLARLHSAIYGKRALMRLDLVCVRRGFASWDVVPSRGGVCLRVLVYCGNVLWILLHCGVLKRVGFYRLASHLPLEPPRLFTSISPFPLLMHHGYKKLCTSLATDRSLRRRKPNRHHRPLLRSGMPTTAHAPQS